MLDKRCHDCESGRAPHSTGMEKRPRDTRYIHCGVIREEHRPWGIDYEVSGKRNSRPVFRRPRCPRSQDIPSIPWVLHHHSSQRPEPPYLSVEVHRAPYDHSSRITQSRHIFVGSTSHLSSLTLCLPKITTTYQRSIYTGHAVCL